MSLACVCLTALLLAQEARAQDGSDLLAIVRAQHRAARESIRSLSADVTVETVFPKKEVLRRGKYWRSFNTVRLQEYPMGTTNVEDALLKDGEIRHVGRHRNAEGQYDRHGAGRGSSAGVLGFCDPWRPMLIEFVGPSGSRYDYDHFLDLAKRPPRVRRETMDGHDCIRLDMDCPTDTAEEWSMTFWHDVKCNYLIRKEAAIFGDKDKNTPTEYEVLEFQEGKPGVFVPVCACLREYDHSDLVSESMTTLSNVRVNEAIANDVFVLPPVPAGTILTDLIELTQYPIDANWKRIGPASKLVPVPAPSSGTGPAFEIHPPAEEKPQPATPWPPWLLPAAAIVVATLAVCLFWRRPSQEQQTARKQER